MSIAADVVKAIDDGYEKEKREKPRRYIGASIIGAPCDAVLAYNLRGFPNDEPDARLKRIFGLGHVLEDMVVKDLKQKADVRVWEVDGLTSKQHSYEAWGGHIVCHMDGHIEVDGELMVLEIKSMNDASFNKFKKDGVKFSHSRYYGQLQMMMGMSDIPKSFFIAINKNNSEYHAETVEYDEFEYAHIKERVERAILGTARKISVDSTDWRCRGCFKRSVCWGGLLEVPRECATCGYAQASPDGAWHCNKHDKNATDTCDDYKVYEPLPKE